MFETITKQILTVNHFPTMARLGTSWYISLACCQTREDFREKPQFHSGAWKRPTKGLKHDQSCPSGPGVDGLRLLKIRIGLPEPHTISRRTMDIWQTKTGLEMGWKVNLGYTQVRRIEEQCQLHSET